MDRVVDIAASDLLAIRSFYQRRVEDRIGRDDILQHQLWGFTANSELPVSGAHAQLEYSIWMPEGSGQDGFADEQNRLVRLRLNDRLHFVNYGANFFSVGNAFVQNPMARERLNAAGLPGPGEGAEVWVSGRLPRLGVEPRFRRVEKSHGNADIVNETFGLAFGHGLAGKSRLSYLLEQTDASTWFEEAAAGQVRESATATVRLQSVGWNLFFKNGIFDEQFAAGRQESGSLWELGGALNVIEGLSLAPVFTGQVRSVGAADLQTSSAGLTLRTSWIDPVAVDLHVQRNRRHNLDGSTFQGTAANLNLRTPLRLWERSPAKMVMTATVGYRGMQGLANPAPEEGMSFRVTVDFNPGF